jgi:putative transposase
MEADLGVRAVEETIAKYGVLEILNTDQGSQFTCPAFIDVLTKHNIKISMDGKGAWRDNVFVERLWKSVKYEEVYLRAYDSVADARSNLTKYLTFYNTKRPHAALDGNTRGSAYFYPPQPIPVAA